MRVGIGIDYHVFEDGKKCFLGGVELPLDYGFKAHSDGDVLIHAIIDALFGACAMGDIGEHFPDTDPTYKNIDSKALLAESLELTRNRGFNIVNLDCVIICEKFKVNPYKKKIKESIASLIDVDKNQVNIKATTPEKMGAIGRCEGIAVHCVISVDERI